MLVWAIIIGVTAIVSVMAFSRAELIFRYDFNPYQIIHRGQWYRIITHAFVHANWAHLIVNMLVLYSFGDALVYYFSARMGGNPAWYVAGLYLGGIVASSIYTLYKERNNYNYSAVGASGAVSAVVFACILFNPLSKIYFFAILPMPGIVFGIIYLAYEHYMSRRGMDNIGHDAHFYGALFGFVYPLLFRPDLLVYFFKQIF
ncbi:MAG: rhomboid family intramembrane serine protease [Salinivirgaceae bacterium]|nr:rhomboid family intramembrane serine protease [Salinivirgaceae bacterium]